jgi:hypothetical protein
VSTVEEMEKKRGKNAEKPAVFSAKTREKHLLFLTGYGILYIYRYGILYHRRQDRQQDVKVKAKVEVVSTVQH